MKQEKAISLISLVITIVLMIIIAGTVISVSLGNLNTKNLTSMYTDLKSINDKIAVYYNKYGTLPIKEKFMGSYEFTSMANPNDEEEGYYIIDINKLDKLILSKKISGTGNDVYIVNTQTHMVYYPEGVELDGEMYYRLPGEYSKLELIDNKAPTVALTPNGGTGYVMPSEGNAKIKTKIEVTDVGGSTLKTLQYAWSESKLAEPTNWTNFSNGEEVSKTDITKAGTWYLWTKVIDSAGNRATNIKTSAGFVVSANTEEEYIIKLVPDYTDWTANDITVTATYGANLIPYSLTCTGTSGTDYIVNGTTSVAVKTNNQTVTSTAMDKAGNIITATLTVTKIDKNPPIVTANAENVTIFEGDSNAIKGYFTYSENGGASITSVEYVDISNNNESVENTNTLSIGTHKIRCIVTKETGKSDYAEITIVVESVVDENGLAKKNVTIKPSEDSNEQIIIPKGWGPAILESSNSTTSLPGESGKVISIMPYDQWKNITVDQINQGIVIVDHAITYTGTVPDFEEFVWVPIPDINQFNRIAWDGPYRVNWNSANTSSSDFANGIHPLSTSAESRKYWEISDDLEVNSVTTYKGFYIGRYEASNNGNNVPKSKRGQSAWTSITYSTAEAVCGNMSVLNAHLISGVEWDSTLNWLIGNAKIESSDIIMTQEDIQNDSWEWGNYDHSTGSASIGAGTKCNTGQSEYWKANNIYDLAGNVWEWTQEDYSTGGHKTARGGACDDFGDDDPVAFRDGVGPSAKDTYKRLPRLLLFMICQLGTCLCDTQKKRKFYISSFNYIIQLFQLALLFVLVFLF